MRKETIFRSKIAIFSSIIFSLTTIQFVQSAHAEDPSSTELGSSTILLQEPLLPLPEGTSAMSLNLPRRSLLERSALSFSYRTLRTTQRVTYREMMVGSGPGGGGSDSASMPNLNYVSAMAAVPFLPGHRVSVSLDQSLDSAEKLQIQTPVGKSISIPSQIVMGGYTYNLNPRLSFDMRLLYMNTFGLLDPSVGVGYEIMNPRGWSPSTNLSFSIPTSENSKNSDLVTRAMARVFVMRKSSDWNYGMGLMQSYAIYNGSGTGGPGGDVPGGAAPNGATGKAPGGAPGEKPSGAPDDVQQSNSTLVMTPIDMILVQKEIMKTGTVFNVGYNLSKSVQVGMGGSLSRTLTEKNSVIWISNVRPLTLRYLFDQMEVAGDVAMNSDIRNYDSPRIPTEVSVGLRMSYLFGDRMALPRP